MNREEVWALLSEYTQSDSLRKHALAVEAAMRFYAEKMGEDVGLWGATGLIHDFDYERWPNAPDHPAKGCEVLRERRYPEELIGAVMSHASWNREEYPLDRPIRKVLFAVDELCGFLTACALVRPQGITGLTPKSVKKKLKQPSFAAAVNREDIAEGAEVLGIELDEHIANCAAALERAADELGLRGSG